MLFALFVRAFLMSSEEAVFGTKVLTSNSTVILPETSLFLDRKSFQSSCI